MANWSATAGAPVPLHALAASLLLAACNVDFQPSVVPIDWTPGAVEQATAAGSIVPGLDVFYETESDFTADQQLWIEQGLEGWGDLIGRERFNELVAAGAAADGNSEYQIRYAGTGGAGHLDQQGVVQFGDSVFAPDNWMTRYRPDPLYQSQEASARISVTHEFAHVIFNGDRTPVEAFEALYDSSNPQHTAVSLNTNAEEALANILALMTEQGTDAPGVPEDLRQCVTNNILPYLEGTAADAPDCH